MMRCKDFRLERLLVIDESSAEYQTTATHVERCSRCQKRLAEISGEGAILVELRDCLRASDETEPYHRSANSSVVISVGSGADESAGADCEPISLDFLSPPSHPEMLGRIGRYEVERMIGTGGMGIVLKGFDTELHRVVAIKVLKPHLAHSGPARHRFAREAQSAAAVVHEHVIPIYDVQSDGDMPFLVMQFVPGQSLQSRVDERGPLDPKEVLRIARQAAAGLFAAHAQGLVHRDVKPANILMGESVDRVLLSDFGLARTADDASLTRSGIIAGTPHYMSPEQASGHTVDHRSDLFSLGSVIYFMCTGRPPFRAEHAMAVLNRICHDTHRPVDQINHEIPAELAEIVDRLLSKQPTDRFHDANEVEQQLGLILARIQKGQSSKRLRWRRNWLRWKRTVGHVTRNTLIVVACVLSGIGLAIWRVQGTPPFVNENAKTGVDLQQSNDRENKVIEQPQMTLQPLFDSDNFLRDLRETEGAVDDLSNRWNKSANSPVSGKILDTKWQQVLEETNGAVQRLHQQFNPVQPSPIERNE